jgi:hypothetical protein
VEKDYFRLLKSYKCVENQEKLRRKNKTPVSLQKFKSRSELLIDEYKSPSVPKERLYVIEKVARIRAQQGRYGVDHSEVLNYEFEMANKERQDHMNTLVYKNNSVLQA